MPSLKAIRKRITTVKNTQKITRAMKLVAAAKLRRAQDAIIAARPYSRALRRVVAELARTERDAHPLFAERTGKKASIVMLTSDRGLAGAFNSTIIRKVESFVDTELSDYTDVSLRAVGRKGNDYFKRRNANIASYDHAPTSDSALGLSHDLANKVIDDFLEDRVAQVFLIFNEFKSAISQGVVAHQLLPIEPLETDEDGGLSGDFLYEPDKEELLSHLAPLYIQNGIYTAALESIASEFGARMTAMDNATRNAGEMIGNLTLQYNRARQAAITKELMEIIGGAEALKG
ncbi:MAG: ATP synthase F1 subunit gamma [Proteobacteria bacterium]|nr:ATP synthase F1 subunit gamma [Pseudomonadota bacterium]